MVDKIEYGSLYKFFVSLGLILIILPFVCLIFLINLDISLINQDEIQTLSDYSAELIQRKKNILGLCFNYFGHFFIVFWLLGAASFIYGIVKWKGNQSKEDTILKAKALKEELESTQMDSSQVIDKATKESTESQAEDNYETERKTNEQSSLLNEKTEQTHDNNFALENTHFMKYLRIENRCFEFLYNKDLAFFRRHFIQRNFIIGRYEYDAVAISKIDDCDVIFEIKYWSHSISSVLLEKIIKRILNAGENYKESKNRKYEIRLIVVSPVDIIVKNDKKIHTCVQKFDVSHVIKIQYVPEEVLNNQ